MKSSLAPLHPLTVKKIPKAVLSRCEWGKDDYSLKVENLPKAPPPSGQIDLIHAEGSGREPGNEENASFLVPGVHD